MRSMRIFGNFSIYFFMLFSAFSTAMAKDDPRMSFTLGGLNAVCGSIALCAICEVYAKSETGRKSCDVGPDSSGYGRVARPSRGFMILLNQAYLPEGSAPADQLDLLFRATVGPDGSRYADVMVTVAVSRTWLPYKLWGCEAVKVTFPK